MGSGATKREILEKKLEKRLQDPKTEPLISLPLDSHAVFPLNENLAGV